LRIQITLALRLQNEHPFKDYQLEAVTFV